MAFQDRPLGAGSRVPDPHRRVLARAGQQLAPVHRHRAYPTDPALVAFQDRALGAGSRVPDPHRRVLARAGQQLAPVHRHGAHPEDLAFVAL